MGIFANKYPQKKKTKKILPSYQNEILCKSFKHYNSYQIIYEVNIFTQY